MKSFAFVALAAILAVVPLAIAQDTPVVDPAIAGMSVDQLVAARQAAMKEDGMLLRSAGQATGDDAVKLATTILQNFTNFPALFREGSITDKSEASPAIWERWDEFEGIFKQGQAAAGDMQAAAETGDAETYKEALNTLGGLCRDCHDNFRAKK
jgi:cytochrome c556